MAGLHYFKFFHERFSSSTSDWSDEQVGAYMRLLIHQFQHGFIPSDPKKIKKIASKSIKNWKLFESKFFHFEDGKLINVVMHEIRNEAIKKSERNRESGRYGGKVSGKRYKSEPATAQADAEANEEQTLKLTNNHKPDKIINDFSSHPDASKVFPIEKCLEIALRDERWVKANKATRKDLEDFNQTLEKRGIYQHVPIEYKSHFANRKSKLETSGTLQTPSQNSSSSAAGQKSLEQIREERHRSQLAEVESNFKKQ